VRCFNSARSCHFGRPLILLLLLGAAAGAPPACGQVAYETRINGVDDPALMELLNGLSECVSRQNDPPASVLHLRRRASRDVEQFERVFQSRGYYGATVSVQIQRDQDPPLVLFEVIPGDPYQLGAVHLKASGDATLPEGALPDPASLGLVGGAPALAEPIAAANATILTHLRTMGYPRPEIARRDVVVDHATRTVAVTYRVDPGPKAVYGDPRYAGLDRTRPGVVDRLLPWKPGEDYDQRQLTTLRTRLYDTGLFATASVEPLVDEIGPDGATPIQVTMTERPPRTMRAGIEFKSDEGIGAQYGWEHRNVRGLGHRFSVETKLATELREIDLRYRIDRFRRLDQTLNTGLIIGQEEREAYNSDRVEGLALLERELSPRLTLSAGAGLRLGRVEQRGVEDTHELLFFPLEARLDHSDSPLDPTRGFKFRARIAPYLDPIGEIEYFTKADAELSYYLGWGALETAEGTTVPRWVLATRVHLGAIWGGQDTDDGIIERVRDALMRAGINVRQTETGIPADLRFYAGGGGSIRGYRFQTVSPLEDNDPVGGHSLAEFSVELRRRLSETLGIVAFLDAGAAFDASYPDFGGDIQLGAGLGVRYYTPLGPLRLDVAVPLNKRSEIDDAFQIYLSIGHAF
jgi:translocation and assembly module TamA